MLPLLPLLALLVCPALGQIGFWGNCPNPTRHDLTNDALLTGAAGPPPVVITWHEQRRYYSWLEGTDYCVNWKYTKTATGKFDVLTSMRRHTIFGFTPITMTSAIEFQNSASTLSNFWYRVTKLPGTNIALPGVYPYYILALADDHLVAWSCKQYWFHHEQMLWILTKDKAPTTDKITAAIDATTAAGLTIDMQRLHSVSQSC